MYMLDTNILIYAMRHPRDKLVQKLIDHACGDICISTITLAELELGVLRSSNPLKNRQSLMAVLSGIDILQFDNTAATEFAIIKEIPHNTAAHLAVPFPTSAACRFLDLPPVNLRNLQLHLSKNSLAS